MVVVEERNEMVVKRFKYLRWMMTWSMTCSWVTLTGVWRQWLWAVCLAVSLATSTEKMVWAKERCKAVSPRSLNAPVGYSTRSAWGCSDLLVFCSGYTFIVHLPSVMQRVSLLAYCERSVSLIPQSLLISWLVPPIPPHVLAWEPELRWEFLIRNGKTRIWIPW